MTVTCGTVETGASPTGSATADPKTAAGPLNLTSTAGATSIALSWSPPTGDYSSTVSAYRVYWIDASVAGSFLDSLRTTATSITPPNLVPGHRYNLAVASINAAREGLPAGAPATIVNGGTPPLPP